MRIKNILISQYPYRYIPFMSPIYWELRYHINRFLFLGKSVYCIVCGNSFNRWVGNARIGEICPSCRSAPRHRLLLKFMEKRFLSIEGESILHIAPEWGIKRKFKKEFGAAYITADLGMSEVDLRCDITKLPFKNNNLQMIICTHVLEHIPEDIKAMSELYRVLKPQGVALIMVPLSQVAALTDEDLSIVDPKTRKDRFGQFDHVRLYGMDITERLKSVGFSVSIECPFKDFPNDAASCGIWDDKIFVCSKK